MGSSKDELDLRSLSAQDINEMLGGSLQSVPKEPSPDVPSGTEHASDAAPDNALGTASNTAPDTALDMHSDTDSDATLASVPESPPSPGSSGPETAEASPPRTEQEAAQATTPNAELMLSSTTDEPAYLSQFIPPTSPEDKLPVKPPFSEIVHGLDRNGPPGNIWGLFGKEDDLGLLNYITPRVTIEAQKEIVHGVRCVLDLGFQFLDLRTGGKAEDPDVYRGYIKTSGGRGWLVTEEFATYTCRSSSQWDGFLRVGRTRVLHNSETENYFYNNHKKPCWKDRQSKNSIHRWNELGIATRGVLLDYERWIRSQNLRRNPFQKTPITAAELRDVATSQNVVLRQGDVLLIRSGYIADYFTLLNTKDFKPGKSLNWIGLEESKKMLEFLWESGISAVAGDMPTLNASPPRSLTYSLYHWLLVGWGCPISRYFDLDDLGFQCARLKRWTFFFTSTPLHLSGHASSPPNAMAIL